MKVHTYMLPAELFDVLKLTNDLDESKKAIENYTYQQVIH